MFHRHARSSRQANEHVLKTVREADAAGGLGDPLVDHGMHAVLGGFSPPPAAVAAVSGRPVQSVDPAPPDDMRFTIRVLGWDLFDYDLLKCTHGTIPLFIIFVVPSLDV